MDFFISGACSGGVWKHSGFVGIRLQRRERGLFSTTETEFFRPIELEKFRMVRVGQISNSNKVAFFSKIIFMLSRKNFENHNKSE